MPPRRRAWPLLADACECGHPATEWYEPLRARAVSDPGVVVAWGTFRAEGKPAWRRIGGFFQFREIMREPR